MTPSGEGDLKIREIQNETSASGIPAPQPVADSPLKKAACLVVIVWAIAQARPFLLPLCIAALLAFMMGPLHRLLRYRLRFPEVLAVAVSALALLSPLAAIIYALVRQGEGLVADFPRLMTGLQSQLTRLSGSATLNRLGISGETLQLDHLLQTVSSSAGQGLGFLVGGLAALANAGSQGILIFIFAILMLSSRAHLRHATEGLLAQTRSLRSAHLVDQVVDLVQRFLIARMVIVLVIGALAAGALALFHVSYGLFLGGFMGIMTLVPAVGFLLALAPILIVSAATGHGGLSLIVIAAMLLAFNCLENYYLTPKMVGNHVNINPLSTFVGLLAGGLLWGIWGMLLSVPVLGVLRIAFSAIPSLRPWGDLLSDSVRAPSP